MNTDLPNTSLYDTDFRRWLAVTAAQVRAQKFAQIDWENLLEEIESLGRSEKNALASYLMRLCEHILKLQYWDTEREWCCRGWKLEMANFRRQIQTLFQNSPTYLRDRFELEYRNACQLFLEVSEIAESGIPTQPEFALEQDLDPNWWPGNAHPGADSKNPTVNPAMVENATEAPPNS